MENWRGLTTRGRRRSRRTSQQEDEPLEPEQPPEPKQARQLAARGRRGGPSGGSVTEARASTGERSRHREELVRSAGKGLLRSAGGKMRGRRRRQGDAVAAAGGDEAVTSGGDEAAAALGRWGRRSGGWNNRWPGKGSSDLGQRG
uniref:Uncharacterized protein n=1 Tax=Oryza brachyantha TaxID=4533 RepID=J3LVK4_ORYBR